MRRESSEPAAWRRAAIRLEQHAARLRDLARVVAESGSYEEAANHTRQAFHADAHAAILREEAGRMERE